MEFPVPERETCGVIKKEVHLIHRLSRSLLFGLMVAASLSISRGAVLAQEMTPSRQALSVDEVRDVFSSGRIRSISNPLKHQTA